MDVKTSFRNKLHVKRFFRLLELQDIANFLKLFAEEAIQINPYASGIFPEKAVGKQGLKDYWEGVAPNFDTIRMLIEELYAMEDPNIVFAKLSGKVLLKNQVEYNNTYYTIFKFNSEGLIKEYREIYNPMVGIRSFGLTDKIYSETTPELSPLL